MPFTYTVTVKAVCDACGYTSMQPGIADGECVDCAIDYATEVAEQSSIYAMTGWMIEEEGDPDPDDDEDDDYDYRLTCPGCSSGNGRSENERVEADAMRKLVEGE